jgi:hypothetical protein
VFVTSLFVGNKIYHFPIEKEAETYNQTRYTQPDGNYHIEPYKGGGFVYKIMGGDPQSMIDLKCSRN